MSERWTGPFTIQGTTYRALGDWAYFPVQPTGFCAFNGSESAFEVVGESRYHDEIAKVIADHDADPDPNEIMAFLIHEDLNPFDHHAIRVDLFHGNVVGTAGYFSKEQAFIFYPLIKQFADIGALMVASVQIYGGTPGKPNYGIWFGEADLPITPSAG
jgi:hypothetical protein